MDLHGQALPGLLSEASGGLLFRENLGEGVLGEAQPLTSLLGLDEGLQAEDRQGRGVQADGGGNREYRGPLPRREAAMPRPYQHQPGLSQCPRLPSR